MVPWQRTVQSSTGPTPQGTVTIESTEAGLDHRRDAQSVRVVTVIPADSLSPDALLDREQAGGIPVLTGRGVGRACWRTWPGSG